MSRVKEFQHYITHEDRIDMEFTIDRGKVVDIAVNYRARIGGAWTEVVRYDTNHGRLHAHRFWRDARRRTEDFDQHVGKDYGAALTRAEQDIKSHWKQYRQRMEAISND